MIFSPFFFFFLLFFLFWWPFCLLFLFVAQNTHPRSFLSLLISPKHFHLDISYVLHLCTFIYLHDPFYDMTKQSTVTFLSLLLFLSYLFIN
jgi:hypothetical protein